jgi:UDP-glucose 4-epimerase
MSEHSVLLLGGTGFLGTALARRLVKEQWKVCVVGRRVVSRVVPGVVTRQASLDDAVMLRELLPHYSAVVHLASTTTPGSSAHSPVRETVENVLPTLRLLEVLAEFEPVRLIYVSSGGTLYGNPAVLPVTEDQPLWPLSNHGVGKVAAEGFLRVYCGQHGERVTILRPSNVYGPEQPLREGFGVIRTMLEYARKGNAMEFWGDGETVRDFLFIEDWVEACWRLLAPEAPAGVFNIGVGEGCSLNSLRAVVERVTGRELRIRWQSARSVDVRGVVLDSTRLRMATGWTPHVTLEDGIRRMWNWLEDGGQNE